MQAIANTAGFHFAYIEQGGASLYTNMALKASDLEVLRIVVSIGGVEVDHFGLWHDKAGNAVATPLAGLVDPVTGLTFPDLYAPPTELTQTNLILPEPCDFIKGEKLPPVPSSVTLLPRTQGAVATIKSFLQPICFSPANPLHSLTSSWSWPSRSTQHAAIYNPVPPLRCQISLVLLHPSGPSEPLVHRFENF
jgi:hypothetical protein